MTQRLPLALSVAALAVAVAGSTPLGRAAAQLVLPRNSVGTAQLRNGAVTGAKVRLHTLLARNFERGQLPKGPRGPAGPVGPSDAFSTFLEGPKPVPADSAPIRLADLPIPKAGAYVIYATGYFDSSGSGIPALTCTLDTLEGDRDQVELLAGNPTPAALSLVHAYAAPGTVELACVGRAAAEAHSVRITAIRVGALVATSAF